MAMRNIVHIDEELCNGCGLCINSCAEGAIQLVDGKARLVKDQYCDGLGACLGECPQGAISVIQRDAEEFNEDAVGEHLTRLGRKASQTQHTAMPHHHQQGGCPGSMMRQFAARQSSVTDSSGSEMPSALRQWPVQLHLVPPTAPYFHDADLVLAADCTAFACGDFHARFLADHAIAIACPKLDQTDGYVEKLVAMICDGGIKSMTVVMMQVPCCRGLERLALLAAEIAGVDIPIRRVIIGVEGGILADETITASV